MPMIRQTTAAIAPVAQDGMTVDITNNGGPAASTPDPVADAITALTTAARGSRDFGEITCQVLTSVAANVGGIEQLLAHRPHSPESAHGRGPRIVEQRSQALRLDQNCR